MNTAVTRMSPIVIVALDVPSLADAQAMVTRVGPQAEFFKVGLQLFAAEGPRVVEWLHAQGKRVFLDLKLHDIPNTVRRAAESAQRMNVALLTVHGLGGAAMVRAAVEGAGDATGVMVVTVLTSMDSTEYGTAIGRPQVTVETEVLRLSAVAAEAGAHGVVTSGGEVAAVRRAFGDRLQALVPGIRMTGDPANDQLRIVTPAAAAANGAAYIIVGRAVTSAPDPAAALERVLAELQ